MHILIASSSVFRQRNYREAVEVMGHRATTATDGVECVHRLRAEFPDMLILEAPLLWGGTEGVLEVASGLTPGIRPKTTDIADRIPTEIVAKNIGTDARADRYLAGLRLNLCNAAHHRHYDAREQRNDRHTD